MRDYRQTSVVGRNRRYAPWCFYAGNPFKVEGLGYIQVRTATLCRLDSSDALIRRLPYTLKL